MSRRRLPAFVSVVLVLLVMVGCGAPKMSEVSGLRAEIVTVIEDLDVPESMLPVPERDLIYISNVESAEDEYWTDDAEGYITLASYDGTKIEPRWLDSAEDAFLNGPKGMAILGDYLYFGDNKRVMRCSLSGRPPERVPLPLLGKANDVATDGERVWVSDTINGKVHWYDPADGKMGVIPAVPGVNGITFHKDRMFAVSWAQHEVYELDPTGEQSPQPFGLADHFTNLDGIEVMCDGTIIVSDFMGAKVCAIGADRRTVTTLLEVESPADIGLDCGEGLLFVPQFMKDRALIVRLSGEKN